MQTLRNILSSAKAATRFVLVVSLLLLQGVVFSYAHAIEPASSREIRIHFPFDNATIQENYLDNQSAIALLDSLYDAGALEGNSQIEVTSFSSPEGNYYYNVDLSKRRAMAMRNFIAARYPSLESRLSINPSGESWKDLRNSVANDRRIGAEAKKEILGIIDSQARPDEKEAQLKQLPAYKSLYSNYFRRFRYAFISLRIENSASSVESDANSEISQISGSGSQSGNIGSQDGGASTVKSGTSSDSTATVGGAGAKDGSKDAASAGAAAGAGAGVAAAGEAAAAGQTSASDKDAQAGQAGQTAEGAKDGKDAQGTSEGSAAAGAAAGHTAEGAKDGKTAEGAKGTKSTKGSAKDSGSDELTDDESNYCCYECYAARYGKKVEHKDEDHENKPAAVDTTAKAAAADTTAIVAPVDTTATEAPADTTATVAPVDTTATVTPADTTERVRTRRMILAAKTNLLYDAVTALNAEIEVPIGRHFSVMIEDVFPWWEWKNKYCFQMWEMGLEARYWFKAWDPKGVEKLRGLFAGVYGMSSKYDFQWDRDINLQGEYWSAGVSAGYAMPIGKRKRINLEFSVAVGPMHTQFRHYQPTQSYDKLIRDPYNAGIDYKTGQWYFGPTKAKISLVVPLTILNPEKEVRHD